MDRIKLIAKRIAFTWFCLIFVFPAAANDDLRAQKIVLAVVAAYLVLRLLRWQREGGTVTQALADRKAEQPRSESVLAA